MTHNTVQIKSNLRQSFPGLEVEDVVIMGEGFRSVAVGVDDRLVFLIGKHERAAKGFEREFEILPRIATALPVQIPNPEHFIKQSETFPFGVLGYPKIQGRTLTKALIPEVDLKKLARDVALLLAELHGFNFGSCDLESPRFFEEDRKLMNDVLPALKRLLPKNEYVLIENWWQSYLGDDANFEFEPVFIHGDLWYENFILDAELKRLVGVVDFEACGLGDIAREFAPLSYLGAEFLNTVVSNYASQKEIDGDGLKKRIQDQWARREFGGVRYSMVQDDEDELWDSIKKIKQGPIFNHLL